MQLKDLKGNVKNPRKISGKRLKALKASIEKFGDLSGFVFNRKTKQLVSGHQRQKSLPPDAKIVIEVKHKQPTKARTVAEGYVMVDGERFKYREVDADKTWETEALLAANKHGGEWDADLLRLVIADTPEINLDLAGFEAPELKALNIDLKPIISDDFLNDEEDEGPRSNEDDDRRYLEEEEKTSEQIDTENGRLNSNPWDEVNEEPSEHMKKKRFVLIIDCKNEELKADIKGSIKEKVEKMGGVFF